MHRKFTCYASVVSEIQQSDIYLTVKARLLETPRANLNGVRVTAAFVDEIIANQQKYVGLPLCADVKNLANGDYTHLGHLYDARTGEFHSAQIGSFYQYEKEETSDGAALVGYARIMKRNKAVCHAISELFTDGKLKFSFEISCGSYTELEDGTIQIDAAEDNFLEGAAVVSFPACENAVALDLVAECNSIADATEGDENKMTDEVLEVVASTEEQEHEEIAEHAEEASEVVEVAEAEKVETAENAEETVEAEKTDETAEVVMVERHETYDSVSAYDTETGEEVRENVSHTVEVVTPISAEAQIAEDSEKEDEEMEEEEDEVASCKKDDKKCAEDYASMIAENIKMIAELKETIESLRKEVAELKEAPAHVVAEVVTAANDANPFISDMPVTGKYSLLEADEPAPRTYTLI